MAARDEPSRSFFILAKAPVILGTASSLGNRSMNFSRIASQFFTFLRISFDLSSWKLIDYESMVRIPLMTIFSFKHSFLIIRLYGLGWVSLFFYRQLNC